MRRTTLTAALAVLLLPGAGAAPIPRDDTPAALIGRWEWEGWCFDGNRSEPLGKIAGLEHTLEFRSDNTVERRTWVSSPETSEPVVSRGTYGVRGEVIAKGWGNGSVRTMTILELTADKMLVKTNRGTTELWKRVPKGK
jgi:hypothetical protein